MTDRSNTIITETLADLYLKNGMKRRAQKIYEMLLEIDPRNERIKEKLLLLSSPSEGAQESSQYDQEERLVQEHEEKGEGGEAYDGRSVASTDSLSFDRLNEMYREMAKQKNERKIRMLKMMLESLTR